jgi:hypothetical protein
MGSFRAAIISFLMRPGRLGLNAENHNADRAFESRPRPPACGQHRESEPGPRPATGLFFLALPPWASQCPGLINPCQVVVRLWWWFPDCKCNCGAALADLPPEVAMPRFPGANEPCPKHAFSNTPFVMMCSRYWANAGLTSSLHYGQLGS